MVIISSVIFAAITLLAISVIAMSLTGGEQRIRQIVSAAHDKNFTPLARRITISTPVSRSADVISLPNKQAVEPAAVNYKEAA